MSNQIKVLKQTELCGQQFQVYGTPQEPLFVASDVATMINHPNTSELVKIVDDDEKLTSTILRAGQNREVWMLTENGLYEVLMQSRKPIAKQFKKGVKAILKEIRTNGGYVATQVDDTPEMIMARALMVAKDTIDRQQAALAKAESKNYVLQCQNDALTSMNERKSKHIRQLMPAATFAHAVETSEHSILVGELARIIKQNGVKIGQNRLFQWMRDKGYLCKKGEAYNQPTQKAMDLGLFEIKKTVIQKPNGDTLVSNTTKVTGKGQVFFVNKFLYEEANRKGDEIQRDIETKMK